MSDNIHVAIRLRPLITRELNTGGGIFWKVEGDNVKSVDDASNEHSYTYDLVFDGDSSNDIIYNTLAKDIIQSALSGINGTIFAYGQTSSGKTYTMSGTQEEPGVIPQAIHTIFHSIESIPDREFLLRVSYMEIYQEMIFDLITGEKISTLQEDTSGQVIIPGLKEICVTSAEKLVEIMSEGDKNRKVGETKMNERSSRSHSIFRLIIESRKRGDKDCEEGVVVSQLNLVDLAGSENASQTGAVGKRLKEGSFINKSLFMLGRVISQLSKGDQHVSFRDSKLTRILQNSLGGNAKTAMICTITPANKDQSLSTLRFASRVKSIKNKPVVNEVLSDAALLRRYAMEIKKLQNKLDAERNTDKAQEVELVREKLEEQEKRNSEMEEMVRSLKEKLVVSSVNVKERKTKAELRRLTWAAPASRRTRFSFAPTFKLPPPPEDDLLAFPGRLPTPIEDDSLALANDWDSTVNQADWSKFSNESSTSPIQESIPSVGEKDKIDADIGSKIKEFMDQDFLMPVYVPKRRKKIMFREPLSPATTPTETPPALVTPTDPPTFADAESQTEGFSLPQPLAIKELTSSPFGTPREVLRLRNKEMKVTLEAKESLLSNWREETRDLMNFHSEEIKVIKEVPCEHGDLPTVQLDPEVQEMTLEIGSLKQSLKDAEQLYLDTNKTLYEKSQEIDDLKLKLATTLAENEKLPPAMDEKKRLLAENESLKNDMRDLKKRLDLLEKEKLDFSATLELQQEKHHQKEAYLQSPTRSLG